jgi:two-component system chemotaxis response regulator CheB
VFKENLACLLLSGANSDGTVGMQKVKKYGGRTIIQNPQSAIVPFMPEYAMEHIVIDAILDPKEMANYINQLQK